MESLRLALIAHRPRKGWLSRWTETAAVAIVLSTHQGETSLLFIRRGERAGDPWSGHVSFPGGKRATIDRDELSTAIRETREETGLDLALQGRLLGELTAVWATTHARTRPMLIRPYVFEVEGRPMLQPSDEAREIFWIPISMLAADRRGKVSRKFLGVRWRFAAHHYQGRVIWGLTLKMLEELLSLNE